SRDRRLRRPRSGRHVEHGPQRTEPPPTVLSAFGYAPDAEAAGDLHSRRPHGPGHHHVGARRRRPRDALTARLGACSHFSDTLLVVIEDVVRDLPVVIDALVDHHIFAARG